MFILFYSDLWEKEYGTVCVVFLKNLRNWKNMLQQSNKGRWNKRMLDQQDSVILKNMMKSVMDEKLAAQEASILAKVDEKLAAQEA